MEHLKSCVPLRESYPCHLCKEEMPLEHLVEVKKWIRLWKNNGVAFVKRLSPNFTHVNFLLLNYSTTKYTIFSNFTARTASLEVK